MNNKRTVIIIGSTGGGKSALANVLLGDDRFKEDESSVSVTKFHQVEEVETSDFKLKIIDTVGLGDTSLTEQEVLYRLADACYAVKDGLNRVFFVTSGRFNAKEVEVYNIMRSVIFTNDITRFVTIVRTNFTKFENLEVCTNDIEKLRVEKSAFGEILTSCGLSMIHVNNPPAGTHPKAAEFRQKSKNKLLTLIYRSEEVYQPPEMIAIAKSIEGYMEEKTRLERENVQIKEDIARQTQEIANLEEKMNQAQQQAQEKLGQMMRLQETMLEQHKGDVAEMNNQRRALEAQFNLERERVREEIVRRQEEAERTRKQAEAIQAQIVKERDQAAAQMREMIAAQERDRAQTQQLVELLQQQQQQQQQQTCDDDDGFCTLI